MNADKKIPHPPQRMNILGRKRYSEDANAKDVIEFSFDDCWRAIGRLHFVMIVLAVFVFWNRRRYGRDARVHSNILRTMERRSTV